MYGYIDYSGVQYLGSIFIGIGIMFVLFVFAYLLYQFSRQYKYISDLEEKKYFLEETSIDSIAKSKGIDINKEVLKRNIFKRNTFRKSLEKEMIKDFFNKDIK